jgi:tetratricopeptide (TPR) repeat protein
MFAHGMQVLALLGDAYGRAGRFDEAVTTGQRARDLARRLGHRGNEARTLYLLGNIHGYGPSPNPNQARDSYQQALTLAHELGMRPLQSRCHLAIGELAKMPGTQSEAREQLTKAAEMFREMGMRSYLEKAESALRAI